MICPPVPSYARGRMKDRPAPVSLFSPRQLGRQSPRLSLRLRGEGCDFHQDVIATRVKVDLGVNRSAHEMAAIAAHEIICKRNLSTKLYSPASPLK
ncbi:hypothetical protein VN97_g7098 [Penicillium thymicola]|uniref:Uncharacterized protein n=1 Tax=Penicillium thymicola TaxID=293382 RepID=A0AAI9X718_PENTH|nr:hypothetical protein VN97_g7098 [Penicillium thymicola]